MTPLKRLVGGLAVAGLCSGCGTGTPSTGATPQGMFGTYRFYERIAGATGSESELEGEFTISADSIVLDARPGPCRYEGALSDAVGIVYSCGGATIGFNRSDPLRRSSYSTSVTIMERQRVCQKFGTGSTGQQICLGYGFERVERRVTKGGLLRPRRIG